MPPREWECPRCVLPRPDEPLAVLLARQPAKAQLVPHGVQAVIVHAQHLAQGPVRDPLLALEQRHHRQEHGVEPALGLGLLADAWLRGRRCSRPDEDRGLFIDREVLGVDELVLQILQAGIVELELALEATIGHPTPLPQECHHLVEHLVEPHRAALSPSMSDDHFTGTSTGAPFFLINITRNFAGLVLLAFRPTT